MNVVAHSILFLGAVASASAAFEGEITAELTRGGETQAFLHTITANHVRIEVTGTDWPHAITLVERQSGEITLIFPHLRSFTRLRLPDRDVVPGGAPGMPMPVGGLPPGIGPQAGAFGMPGMPPVPPGGIGPTNLPGFSTPFMPHMANAPALPAGIGAGAASAMPAMPMISWPDEPLELEVIDEQTKLLGYECARYELKLRGEVMTIWATDELPAFQPYLHNQPLPFGPRMIEEQWGELLKARKLFPLLAILKSPHGTERMRFEVKTTTPAKSEAVDRVLFHPPGDYHELAPLAF